MKKTVVENLIEKFGNCGKVAQAAGVSNAAVTHWKKRDHGRVPSGRWSTILKAARKRGIALTFEDLAK